MIAYSKLNSPRSIQIFIESSDKSSLRPLTEEQCARIASVSTQHRPVRHVICSKTNKYVVEVERKDKRYYRYEYNVQLENFFPHECSCQPIVLESDLLLRYAVYSHSFNQFVYFCWNKLTCRVEQYILNKFSIGFEQVHCPELVYNEQLFTPKDVRYQEFDARGQLFAVFRRWDGVIRRCIRTNRGHMSNINQTFVRTLRLQLAPSAPVGSPEEPPATEEDPEIQAYIDRLPEIRLHYSLSEPAPEIYGISRKTGKYAMFSIDETGNMVKTRELILSNTRERNLFPMYAEYYQEIGRHVIHAENRVTCQIEQFVYDPEEEGFKQVDYPELKYDSSKRTFETLLFIDNDQLETLILRAKDGSLRKERFWKTYKNVTKVPERVVTTFLWQSGDRLQNNRRVQEWVQNLEVPRDEEEGAEPAEDPNELLEAAQLETDRDNSPTAPPCLRLLIVSEYPEICTK
ncbi:unnamed protein product [Caenorhabditis brenneri]